MYDIYVRCNTLDLNETEDEVLWAPDMVDTGRILYTATLDLELNHSGKLTFQMSPRHPLYGDIHKRKTRVIVRRDGSEIWRGRVLDTKTDFYKRKTVICEGALSYLLDTTVLPYEVTGTVNDFVKKLIDNHNLYCDFDKKIVTFQSTVVEMETEITIPKSESTECPSTLDELNEQLINRYGGYLQVVYSSEHGGLVLQHKPTTGEQINQEIRFAKNLLDFEHYITTENVCTRCIPRGTTSGGTQIDITNMSIDTASAYDGIVYESDIGAIEHVAGATMFGRVAKCVTFNDVESKEKLFEATVNWLNENATMNVTMEIKAIDLSLLMDDIDAVDCGVSARVISDPHGIDTWMTCSSLSLDILSPAETEYVFGVGFSSLTGQQAETSKKSEKAVSTANGASASVANSVGKYITASEFNLYKDEINKALEDVNSLPEPTSLDNGKILKIVDGEWAKAPDTAGDIDSALDAILDKQGDVIGGLTLGDINSALDAILDKQDAVIGGLTND